MLFQRLFFAVSFLFAIFFYTPNTAQTASAAAKSKYNIERSSELKLKGTTNINSFSCKCKEQFTPQQFTVQGKSVSGVLQFTATYLYVPITALDCGNKKMNSDMQNALNAHVYPKIKIELIKAEEEEHCPSGIHCEDDNEGWLPMKVFAKISMNGHSNDYWIHINAKKETTTRLYFKGSKRLRMSDFSVIPPEVFFGTVKVNDSIEIVFDLLVSIS